MFSFATKFSPEAVNFEKAVFAGFEHAELYLTPTRLMSWRSLSKIARSYDLNCILHFPTEGKITNQTCEEIVSLARDLGSRIITVHEENLDVAGSITQLDSGIRLGVENRNLGFDELDAWIESHNGVTLDIDRLWQSTLNQCEWTELRSVVKRLLHQHRERIINIHMSGHVPGQSTQQPLTHSSKWVCSIFELLLEEEYNGVVVGEIDANFQQVDHLKADYQLFHQWRTEKNLKPAGIDTNRIVDSSRPIPETF